MKQLLYHTLYRTRLHRVLGRSSPGIVLMLHRVTPAVIDREFHPNGQFAMTPTVLVRILEALADLDFDIVSLDEALNRLTAAQPTRRFACLTFDDGYRDNFEIAYPIMRSHDAPMTTYVTTGFVDRTDPIWAHGLEECIANVEAIQVQVGAEELRFSTRSLDEKQHAWGAIDRAIQSAGRPARAACYAEIKDRYGVDIVAISDALALTWDELVEFDAKPGVTIGAHTIRHSALSALEADAMREEIAGSRDRLQQVLGHEIRHFAYPFGDTTTTGEREFDACRDLGFASATTTRHAVLSRADASAPHSLPRIPTDPFESERTLAAKITGVPGMIKRFEERLRQRRRSKTRTPARMTTRGSDHAASS